MKIAVIQIRGIVGVNGKLIDTLNMLKLTRKNSCAILDNNPMNLGMIVKVKDLVTWGEIDTETFKLLVEKRGKLPGGKPLTEVYLKEKSKMGYEEFAKAVVEGKMTIKDMPGMKQYFRLTPPRGGFDKNGIKKPYSLGGALGYRKSDINNLLRKML